MDLDRMRTGSVAFLVGVLLALRLPALPPPVCLALVPLVVVLMARRPSMRIPGWAACGFLCVVLHGSARLARGLEPAREGQPLIVEGWIASLPADYGASKRFEFEPRRLEDSAGRVVPSPGRIRLGWYGRSPEIVPGDRWRLRVRLKRPRGFSNPGGFDYEGWLFQRGVRATGYVLGHGANRKIERTHRAALDRLRYALRKELNAVLADAPLRPLILALVIGDRGAMSRAHWDALTTTGTSHLLAISGLHIGLVAGFMFLVVRVLWPLTGALESRFPAHRAAAIGALAAAGFYAGMAGFAIPTRRALIMLAALLFAVACHRQLRAGDVLAAALIAVLIMDPFAAMSPGFWLSFGAVAVILLATVARVDTTGPWWKWGRIQCVLALGLVPVLAFWFQRLPLSGIAANLVAVPWVSLTTVPLSLAGALMLPLYPPAGAALLHVAVQTLDLLWPFLKLLAQSGSAATMGEAPVVAALAAAAGVVWMLMPAGVPGRWLGVCWMLPLLFAGAPERVSKGFRFVVLDVGQGLSAVVQTRNRTLLYDAGPKFNDRFNAGDSVVVPFLRASGVRRVDTVVQSHGDSDHIGGLPAVLSGIPAARILSSVPGRIRGASAAACRAGQQWVWDGVRFEIMHPAPDSGFTGNNRSCVLKVSYSGHAALLPGDIERGAEAALVRSARGRLGADILVAPHHGSGTSSSTQLIDAVQPRHAVFPVGYRNRFGFPKQAIIARYRQYGIEVLETARSGAIEFLIDDSGISVTAHRRKARRFWHSRP